MRTALITGSNGFVGRRIVRRLLGMGFEEITCVDDLSTGLPFKQWPNFQKLTADELTRIVFYPGDLRLCLRNGFLNQSFDLVFHCAAVVGGRLMIEGDPIRVASDLAIDAELFNWAVIFKPRKLIYFSSSAVYPVDLQERSVHCPLSETAVRFDSPAFGMPDLTYGFAKLSGEYLAHIAVKTHKLNVAVYRPFSGYGEDQDLSYPFPAIVQRIVNQENPITVWGDGEQTRDFIHIEDVIDAVFATMGKMHPGETLNLGSGEGVSFNELIHRACRITGHRADIAHDLSKPVGVAHRVCDSWKISRYFRPKISLEEGIERAIIYRRALTKQAEAA